MKSILASKTFWFNLLTGLAGAVEASGLVDVVPTEWQGPILIGMAGVNIVLRALTYQPVKVLP